MSNTKLISILKEILNKFGQDNDILVNRKISIKHENEIEVLLQHIMVLVEYLKLDIQATRNELFELKKLVEDYGEY